MEAEEQQELQSLKSFYEDLDPLLVEETWNRMGRDYKAAMEELAEIAKNPSSARFRGAAGPAGGGGEGGGAESRVSAVAHGEKAPLRCA
jgi:hypothetical protein